MSVAPKPPLTRDRAWACIMLNLSVPGWGSIKAGRKFAGLGEIIIVFAGLFFLFAWFFEWMNRIMQSELGDTLPPVPSNRLWQWGVILIVISWVWTVLTCIGLMREAKANEEKNRQNTPPRLSDLPKPPKLS